LKAKGFALREIGALNLAGAKSAPAGSNTVAALQERARRLLHSRGWDGVAFS